MGNRATRWGIADLLERAENPARWPDLTAGRQSHGAHAARRYPRFLSSKATPARTPDWASCASAVSRRRWWHH